MKRYNNVILMFLTLVLLLFGGCSTDIDSKNKHEITRLIAENKKLEEEIETYGLQNTKLTADIKELEQELKLGLLGKEVDEDKVKRVMDALNTLETGDGFEEIFRRTDLRLVGEVRKKYNEKVYEAFEMQKTKTFVNTLAKHDLQTIDNVTSALSEYVKDSELSMEFNKLIASYVDESKLDKGSDEYYITLRIRFLTK